MVLTGAEPISQEYPPFMTREYLTSAERKRRGGGELQPEGNRNAPERVTVGLWTSRVPH